MKKISTNKGFAHSHMNEVSKPLCVCLPTKCGVDLTEQQSPAFDNMSFSIVKSDDTSQFLIAHLKRVTI